MTSSDFEYVRAVSFEGFRDARDQRHTQQLVGRASGCEAAAITVIRTPPGGGSPEGLHTHVFDQFFYVLEGNMNVEIDGSVFEVKPGSVVVFPKGVPHQNWTAQSENGSTLHLAINVPAPEAGMPTAQRVR